MGSPLELLDTWVSEVRAKELGFRKDRSSLPKERVAEWDVLRGIAFLAIVLQHAIGAVCV